MTLMSVLGVIFIVLKLVGVIAWSWWFVLMPFYIGWLFIFLWLVLVASMAGGTVTVRNKRRR